MVHTRRRFLDAMALAGVAGLVSTPRAAAAEPPPETTAIRLAKVAGICIAPQYVAEELLHAEGFTEVRYVAVPGSGFAMAKAIGADELDFSLNYAAPLAAMIDVGTPITLVAGIHVGCFELFGREGLHGIADLKGRSVGVQGLGSSQYIFLAAIAANIGLDPVNDIRWVIPDPSVKPIELFAEGKIDAFLGFPPEPQELRARGIGHVIVNSALDRPWSEYFCCMLAGNREFVRNHPVATKRVLRAILKATDLCATAPERVARRIVDRGFTARYDYALQTLTELPYDKWREYDAEDTIRFYALRLHEIGLIKSTPQQIIAEGTDWRFLNELKRELKS
jgi:NitT/TauT family transport system substrate-binding protein